MSSHKLPESYYATLGRITELEREWNFSIPFRYMLDVASALLNASAAERLSVDRERLSSFTSHFLEKVTVGVPENTFNSETEILLFRLLDCIRVEPGVLPDITSLDDYIYGGPSERVVHLCTIVFEIGVRHCTFLSEDVPSLVKSLERVRANPK